MLTSAVMFWQVILAVHIIAVVVAFGVVFTYPLMVVFVDRVDPRSIPVIHRLQQIIGRRVVSPGLLIVLLAGIYLASHLDQGHQFYVQWAIAVVVVLGALEGAVMIRSEGRLAELAERDLAAAPAPAGAGAGGAGGGLATDGAGPSGGWSREYLQLRARSGLIGSLMVALVVVTVYLMTVQA